MSNNQEKKNNNDSGSEYEEYEEYSEEELEKELSTIQSVEDVENHLKENPDATKEVLWGFCYMPLLKIINHDFPEIVFDETDSSILGNPIKVNEVNIQSETGSWIYYINTVGNDYRSGIIDLMETNQIEDQNKSKLLLSLDNLIGVVKLTYKTIQEKYEDLKNFNVEADSNLTLYIKKDSGLRLGFILEEKN